MGEKLRINLIFQLVCYKRKRVLTSELITFLIFELLANL